MAELIDPKLAYPQLVRKGYTAAVEINDDEQFVIARISTDCVDRDGEVLLAKGAITDQWHKNRVVMWTHQYGQPAIGLGHWIRKEPNGILAKYEPAQTQFAQEIYTLYRAGVMKAFSVGFITLESHVPTEKELKERPEWKSAKRIISKWELLEFSACAIGINPETLALAVGKGLVISEETQKAVGLQDTDARLPMIKDEDIPKCPPCAPPKTTEDAAPDMAVKLTMELPGKAVTIAEGMKPFPNEHSCDLAPGEDFERYARQTCEEKHDGKCIDVMFGINGDKSKISSLRYKKDIWTAADARAHCKTREGSFEAAGEAERATREATERQASKEKAFEQQKEIIGSQAKTIGVLEGALIRANKEVEAGAKFLTEARAQIETAKEIAHEYIRHTTGRIT